MYDYYYYCYHQHYYPYRYSREIRAVRGIRVLLESRACNAIEIPHGSHSIRREGVASYILYSYHPPCACTTKGKNGSHDEGVVCTRCRKTSFTSTFYFSAKPSLLRRVRILFRCTRVLFIVAEYDYASSLSFLSQLLRSEPAGLVEKKKKTYYTCTNSQPQYWFRSTCAWSALKVHTYITINVQTWVSEKGDVAFVNCFSVPFPIFAETAERTVTEDNRSHDLRRASSINYQIFGTS